MSKSDRRVVITGLGAVTPLGTGAELFWQNLIAGKSGVRTIQSFDPDGIACPIAAEVRDYDAVKFVKQRKTLKLMSRDIQLAMGGAFMAVQDAGIDLDSIDKLKFGVNYGAGLIATEIGEISAAVRATANSAKEVDLKAWGKEGFGHLFPLWMLKYLPNMPACHVSIAYDAQGPNNSITVGEASSTLAIGEAFRVIQRGTAQTFIAGGTDSRIHPLSMVRLALLDRLTKRISPPEAAIRPFDHRRDGTVPGEGTAALFLEEWQAARQRGAKIYGEILGFGSACNPASPSDSLASAIGTALRDAKIQPKDLGHISAVGISGVQEDRDEAIALAEVLGSDVNKVPITAYKSSIGSLSAASGAVELVASLLAMHHGQLPAILNFEKQSADMPKLRLVTSPEECPEKPFVSVSRSYSGQCAALVVGPVS
ncbi:beta-ketoacyl-[acyl-carrier-protein] synthase family protein [bacterium]|nr:beta-ketoacyl-[acyl-carrier-protein] synthase family protein [bacterium]